MHSTLSNLQDFPENAKQDVGFQLDRVQRGLQARNFKPMRGIGSGVEEIKIDEAGNTYRVVYVAKFEEAIYVLDAFQKKSPSGSKLPKNIIDRLKDRYNYVKDNRPAKGQLT